jgi:NADH:ubiquinone oxidoreductase subunit 5 (subunit L)/multisubunit Na+/H+ antiporter MnhA subunit
LRCPDWLSYSSAGSCGAEDFFPRRLGDLSLLAGFLLLLVYLGRLIIFDPDNAALLVVAAVTCFVVTPALYAWLGLVLRRGAA